MSSAKEWIDKRLLDMSNLKDDWVSGGYAIKERALKFTDAFFSCIDDYDHWDLGPYPNGSIIITYNNETVYAAINVAEVGISVFVVTEENSYVTLECKFEDGNVLDRLLTFINDYF